MILDHKNAGTNGANAIMTRPHVCTPKIKRPQSMSMAFPSALSFVPKINYTFDLLDLLLVRNCVVIMRPGCLQAL